MNERIDPTITGVYRRFFDDTPVFAEIIDSSIDASDFRKTVIVTTEEGTKRVLKLASNDFTFPEKMFMWQRTVEEYLDLGYYCPRILCDRNNGFPSVSFRGHTCFVHAEEYSQYGAAIARNAPDEEMTAKTDKYLKDIWSMTAKIAAMKLDYTDYPSGYCLFEPFSPGDQVDEVMENALKWKRIADSLPTEFSRQVGRIWREWNGNREALKELYRDLPTSVFQGDLNATNLLVDEDGRFMGVYDFNLCGKDVLLNYLMRENNRSEKIPEVLKIVSEHYRFSEKEKRAALPLFRYVKPLSWDELKDAGNDKTDVRRCLDQAESLLNEDRAFEGCMD